MKSATLHTLEDAIRDAGEAWLLETSTSAEAAARQLTRELEAVQREADRRLGPGKADFSEAALLREYLRNPGKMRSFFQALGGRRTPAMLCLVWCILQGAPIKQIQLAYAREQSFYIQFVLGGHEGGPEDVYESTNIRDFALFRRLGAFESDGLPVFDGFYALRMSDG